MSLTPRRYPLPVSDHLLFVSIRYYLDAENKRVYTLAVCSVRFLLPFSCFASPAAWGGCDVCNLRLNVISCAVCLPREAQITPLWKVLHSDPPDTPLECICLSCGTLAAMGSNYFPFLLPLTPSDPLHCGTVFSQQKLDPLGNPTRSAHPGDYFASNLFIS